MSYPSECGACISGNHEKHRRDQDLRIGLIGGTYCPCKGGCASRQQLLAEFFPDPYTDEQARALAVFSITGYRFNADGETE